MDKVDCVVIGAGVVGLAVARRAGAGRPRGDRPRGRRRHRHRDLLAQQRGDPRRHLLPRRQPDGADLRQRQAARSTPTAREHGVPHAQLRQADRRDDAEGRREAAVDPARTPRPTACRGMQLLCAAEAHARWSRRCTARSALLSPSTGIIDSHAFMLALQGDAEDAGAAPVLFTPRCCARRARAGGIEIDAGGDAPMTLRCRLLVNAAGLRRTGGRAQHRRHADRTAYRAPISPRETISRCSARAPFSRLIYPVPEPGGLGVHLTLDLAGQARFGPDVEWVDAIDYAVDPARADGFYPAIRQILAGAAGRRADAELFRHPAEDRAAGGAPAQDFVIQGPRDARRRRADQPVRHRVARTDVVAGDRRPCRRTGWDVAQCIASGKTHTLGG